MVPIDLEASTLSHGQPHAGSTRDLCRSQRVNITASVIYRGPYILSTREGRVIGGADLDMIRILCAKFGCTPNIVRGKTYDVMVEEASGEYKNLQIYVYCKS